MYSRRSRIRHFVKVSAAMHKKSAMKAPARQLELRNVSHSRGVLLLALSLPLLDGQALEHLGLVGASGLLHAVLPLLALLARGLARGALAGTDHAVLRLVLLGCLGVVIDQAETGATTTAKLGAEAEEDHGHVILSLVHVLDLALELLLADVGSARVNDIDNHLLAREEPVCEELPRPHGVLLRHDTVLPDKRAPC